MHSHMNYELKEYLKYILYYIKFITKIDMKIYDMLDSILIM